MVLAGQALALIRGRDYALAGDLTAVAADVLRHRLVLSYEALAEEVTPDDIIARVLQAIPAPEVTPHAEGRPERDEQQWMPRQR
jgi:MoxR-like ATPase